MDANNNSSGAARPIRICGHRLAEAEFDPWAPGACKRVNTDVGTLLLSVGTVEPYLDGYKVGLEIGNPLPVTINEFEILAAWGPSFKPEEDYAKRLAAKQTKKITATQQLSPGKCTRVDIILPSTEAGGFGFLNLRIAIDRFSLATPSR